MTTAIRQVAIALKAVCQVARPLAVVKVDRDSEEPFTNLERANGALNIRCVACEMGPSGMLGQGVTEHRASFQIDVHTDNQAGATIDEAAQEIIADIIAGINENRSLGVGVQSTEEQQISAGGENIGRDTGCVSLDLAILFFTPRGDFRTIIPA